MIPSSAQRLNLFDRDLELPTRDNTYDYNATERPFDVPTKELFVLNSSLRLKTLNKKKKKKNGKSIEKKKSIIGHRNNKWNNNKKQKYRKNTLKKATLKSKHNVSDNSYKFDRSINDDDNRYQEALKNAKEFSTFLKSKSKKSLKRSNNVSKLDLENYHSKINTANNMLLERSAKHSIEAYMENFRMNVHKENQQSLNSLPSSTSSAFKSLNLDNHDIFNKSPNISNFTSSLEKDLGYLKSEQYNDNSRHNNVRKKGRHQQRPSSAPSSRHEKKQRLQLTSSYSCLDSVHTKYACGRQKPPSDLHMPVARISRKMPLTIKKSTITVSATKNTIHNKNNNNIKPTFIINHGKKHNAYEEIAIALRNRGWLEETRKNVAPNLLWDINDNEIDLQKKKLLGKKTLYNHFKNNRCMTTKIGLRKSLENLTWINSTSSSNFVPTCFDIGESGGREDFKHDFIIGAAISILFYSIHRKTNNGMRPSTIPYKIILSCIIMSWFYIRESYVDEDAYCTMFPNIYLNLIQNIIPKIFNRKNFENNILKYYYDLNNKRKSNSRSTNDTNIAEAKDGDVYNDKIYKIMENFKLNFLHHENSDDVTYFNNKINRFIKKFTYDFPNFMLSLKHNTWIIKLGSSSRAVGLKLSRNMEEILHEGKKMGSRLVQRYIEQPCLIGKKKFDLRVWVLVTSLSPLKVYYFNSPYLRVCSKEYKINASNELLNDRYVHLSNCCVNKWFNKVKNNEDLKDFEADGNVLSLSQFQNYLTNNLNKNVDNNKYENGKQQWEKSIEPKIKKIIKSTIEVCAFQMEDLNNNSFELYGFDIILDNKLKPWLLEVNLSPFFSGRTPFLKQLITKMVDGLIKLTVDKVYNPDVLLTQESKKKKEMKTNVNDMKKDGNELDGKNKDCRWKRININNSNVGMDNANIFVRNKYDIKVVGRSVVKS